MENITLAMIHYFRPSGSPVCSPDTFHIFPYAKLRLPHWVPVKIQIHYKVETKRMLLGRSFLAAWLIACFSIAAGQTYPSLKKALTCGTFISLLDGSLKSQMVSFAIPVAAVLPWSDSFLQEYKSGFLKAAFPRTNRRLYVEGKVFSVMTSGFLVWIFAISTILLVNFVIFYPMEIKGSFPKEQFLELLMKALRMGLIGSILSTFGGICGTLWNSAYIDRKSVV